MIEGDPAVIEASDSQSGAFLRGELTGVVPAEGGRRKPEGWIRVLRCAENNLKKIDVAVPRGVLASLCGLSGSGKSTFLYEIFYKGLRMKLDREYRDRPGKFGAVNLRNRAGKADARAVHATLMALLHSNWAAVAATDEWCRALGRGVPLPCSNLVASAVAPF